jgi:hypothetical protein
MNNRIILSITIACFLTAACNDNTSDKPRTDAFSEKPVSKQDSLEKDVMDGHDVAMAKMSRIRKYLAQISLQRDSISKLPVIQQNKTYQQALTDLDKDLQKADSSMNAWMEAYVIDSAKDNKELRIKYLESEKEKVDAVKKLVLESVQRADSLLKKP